MPKTQGLRSESYLCDTESAIPCPNSNNPYLVKVWRQELGRVEALRAGVDLGEGRNVQVLQAAAALAAFLHTGAWSESDIRDNVGRLASERQVSAWESALESGIARGKATPRLVPEFRPLSNYTTLKEGGKVRKPIPEIVKGIEGLVNCGGCLFTETEGEPIESAAKLTAWAEARYQIQWSRGGTDSLASWEEVRAGLLMSVRKVQGIEALPHYPPYPDTLYLPWTRLDPDLESLLGLLNPATEADRALLLAALLTPLWGGREGGRPAIVLYSAQRGAGKSCTAQTLGWLYGGALTIQEREVPERAVERLLAPGSAKTRVVLIDNLKGHADSALWESLITAEEVAGHRLYHGSASRPNRLTWVFTANTPSLSPDMASRSVLVQIGTPKHGAPFVETVRSLSRDAVLSGLLDVLEGQPLGQSTRHSRFSEWDSAVLARVSKDPDGLSDLLQTRRVGVDEDLSSATELAAVLARVKGPLTLDGLRQHTDPILGPPKTPQALWRKLRQLLTLSPLSDWEISLRTGRALLGRRT